MAIFAAGTRTFIVGSTAPPGWTKDTTNHNNHKLRVTSGTASFGGSRDFDTVFSSQGLSGTIDLGETSGSTTTGGTTLTSAQLPQHTHGGNFMIVSSGAFGSPGTPVFSGYDAWSTGYTGSSGAHTHPLGTLSMSVSATPDFNVKYVDVILVTKD